VGVPYSQALVAINGVLLSLVRHGSASGLTLDPATGILSGHSYYQRHLYLHRTGGRQFGLSTNKIFSLLVNPPPLVLTTNAVFPRNRWARLLPGHSRPPVESSLPLDVDIRLTSGPGLTFDPGSATISGTPQTTGKLSRSPYR